MTAKKTFGVLILALLCLASCDGNKSDNLNPIVLEPNFTSLYNSKFGASACVSCHEPGGEADNLDLNFSTRELAFQTLTNGNAMNSTIESGCQIAIISAGSTASSYLALFFDSTLNDQGVSDQAACNPISKDHIQSNYMSAAEVEVMLEWITNGAEND